MKTPMWKPSLLALFICAATAACADRSETAATGPGEMTPAATQPDATSPDSTAAIDPYATPTDATDPMADPMAPTTDISGTAGATGTASSTNPSTGSTGDMSDTTGDAADRCAGLAGQALTECLEVESMREQPMDNPDAMEDATDVPTP